MVQKRLVQANCPFKNLGVPEPDTARQLHLSEHNSSQDKIKVIKALPNRRQSSDHSLKQRRRFERIPTEGNIQLVRLTAHIPRKTSSLHHSGELRSCADKRLAVLDKGYGEQGRC